MTSATIDPRLHRIVAAQPYPLLFATISGAHLYGFPSPDSDCDLRAAYILPLENVVGLDTHGETVEDSRIIKVLRWISCRTTCGSSSVCCSRRTATCSNSFIRRSSSRPGPNTPS